MSKRFLGVFGILLLALAGWKGVRILAEDLDGEPLRNIPSTIPSTRGKLSLFADFSDVTEKGVALYVINRSTKTVALPAEDGDVYAKLERKAAGNWQRAQPHEYSWCGNSYHTISLQPGRYLRVRGYVPANGEPSTVRYRLFNSLGLLSNAGTGVADPNDVRHASQDEMAIRFGDAKLVKCVLFGDDVLPTKGNQREHRVSTAIDRLRDLPLDQSIPMIQKIVMDPEADDNSFSHALRVWHDVDREASRQFFLKSLREGPSRRTIELAVTATESHHDPEILPMLTAMVEDPQNEYIDTLIGLLGNVAEAEARKQVEQLLKTVQHDNRYAPSVRERARYTHQLRYGSQPIEIALRTRQELQANSESTELLVTLSSKTRQEIAYSDPSELIRIFVEVTDEGSRYSRFVEARKAVQFQRSNKTPSRRETVGGTDRELEFTLELADYFDLSALRDQGVRYLTVWVSVQTPNSAKTPKLLNAGKLIDLAPQLP